MKQTRLFMSAFLVMLLPVFRAEARPRLAVQPFKNPPGFEEACPLGAGLAEMVRLRLIASGKMQIVGREDLETMKGEIDRAKDDYFDPSTFPEKGGFQGADYLLTGKVLDFGHFSKDTGLGTLGKLAGGFEHKKTIAYVRISMEVVDLKTGKLALSDNFEGREEQKGVILLAGDLKKMIGGAIKIGTTEFNNSMMGKAANKALDHVTPKIAALFAMEAKVLAVSPQGIVIDMGTASGIKPGQRCKLFSVTEIKNSQGRVVWSSKKLAGELIISEVNPDGALAQSSTSIEAREGDVVEFAP